MKKATFIIRTNKGFESVSGYMTDDGKHGVDKRFENAWYLTDIATGIALSGNTYKSRKAAVEDIERAENAIIAKGCRDNEKYAKAVAELKKFKGVDTESEGKEMAKTNTKAKAKADTNKALESENKALKKELEILKKQIEELTRVEKTTIDTFDVEGYLASRDNSARITAELVEALENTEGLTVTRRGKDEWLYVSGATEADTKDRKDIFKAMGFRFSAPEKAWFLAPYPLRSAKAWGAKKARATA